MKIIMVGDIVGKLGRQTLIEYLPQLKSTYSPNAIIVNGENAAANGRGITREAIQELLSYGIDCITLGNHTWRHPEIFDVIDQEKRIVRPYNYPPGTPGQGWTTIETTVGPLNVINLMGRVFMQNLDCPFQGIDQILTDCPPSIPTLVDIHAETTSEKQSLAWYLDGRVSAVVGTHTHVQTADERILPKGTGYISDLGMVGAYDGVLGMERSAVIRGFTTQLPVRYSVATGRKQLNALFIEVDRQTQRTKFLKRICVNDDHPFVD